MSKTPKTSIMKAHERSERDSGPRKDKRGIMGYFSPELSKEIRQLALDQDTTVQALVGEALDRLLVAYGKEPYNE
jgi:hypothetical protein|tara:strand:- start:30262 stop:30486 length:225 start_codon:yes stop_codon:yes gene_type:complete